MPNLKMASDELLSAPSSHQQSHDATARMEELVGEQDLANSKALMSDDDENDQQFEIRSRTPIWDLDTI
ncbi:unnamed protein product [Linum trigynum]|uniref:Uncharacterized protein n=1 Tax=Linum trigynum TaxID=586398 RepID=A0AAV2DWK8_9ROSI